MGAAVSAGRERRGSIISPVVDFLSVGGLSILVLVPLLLSGRTDLVMIGAGAQAWVATSINMPHFMASYRLVYRSRETMRRHRWAAFGVPAILLCYLLVATWQAQESPVLVIVLVTVASTYLAWHYTGQVWGMMASHAYLAGTGFDARERRLVKSGLRILLAWHLTWFAYTQLRDPSRVAQLYQVVSGATVLAFLLGAAGLGLMYRRTGRVPPLLAVTAWLAIFVWYAVMARDPKALFWVQIAHAIQYLAFPVRMEINRTVAEAGDAATSTSSVARRVATHMAAYGVLLLGISWLMGQVVPVALMGAVGSLFGEEPARAAPILILMFINIHHYFTDGVLWKLRNPEVRQELFAHLKPR
jgi:hypothetical protein